MTEINPTYSGIVHSNMCDVMGHMNARHYLAMFDDASYALLEYLSGGPLLTSDPVGWADVRCVIDYLREVTAGANLIVVTQIEKIGRTSLTMRHELHDRDDKSIRAVARVISVRFDKTKRAAAPIEAELRARAEALLAEGDN